MSFSTVSFCKEMMMTKKELMEGGFTILGVGFAA
jgi:hypothetical protein